MYFMLVGSQEQVQELLDGTKMIDILDNQTVQQILKPRTLYSKSFQAMIILAYFEKTGRDAVDFFHIFQSVLKKRTFGAAVKGKQVLLLCKRPLDADLKKAWLERLEESTAQFMDELKLIRDGQSTEIKSEKLAKLPSLEAHDWTRMESELRMKPQEIAAAFEADKQDEEVKDAI